MRKFSASLFMVVLICLSCAVAFAASEETGPNFGAYALKDGHVYKNGKELDCEVYEAPEELANGIKAWAVIGAETSDAVTEADTGVWFFGEEADFFIPLESEYEFQGLLASPAGDRLILATGSEMREDVFFSLYVLHAKGKENMAAKEAEFSGARGEIAWFGEGMRFAFTRIDDTREETGELANAPYWLRLSAVLYDSAVNETTVLKESTDTQNFRFSYLSEDDGNIALSEEYVESPKDWADEDKVKTREITVPVPPAG
jgi:hypothetical protein